MKPVWWLPDARAELTAASDWYESQQAGLGVEFVEEVAAVVRAIAEAPTAFPRWARRREVRKAVVGSRFPYVLFFAEESDEVSVYALAHTRRKPGYWVERLGGP